MRLTPSAPIIPRIYMRKGDPVEGIGKSGLSDAHFSWLLQPRRWGRLNGHLAILHRLTVGHLDPAAVKSRQTVPTKALEIDVVHRLLAELGEKDAEGHVTLGGCK